MRKILVTLLACVLLPLSAAAAQFKEGVHYDVLPGQPTNSPEVMEFFSFYCGHCWNFEPVMNVLEKGIQGAKVQKSHVEFLGGPKRGPLMTQGYATALVLKVEKEVSALIFKRHFIERNYIQTLKELREVFIEAGVKGSDFDKAYNSFPTNSLVARMAQKTKKYRINATPKVVVNGIYQVKNSSISKSANPEQEYVKLVNYLLTKDSK